MTTALLQGLGRALKRISAQAEPKSGPYTLYHASGGTPATPPTITTTSGVYFDVIPNTLTKEQRTFADIPIFSADWWAVEKTSTGELVTNTTHEATDIISNGTAAYLFTGKADMNMGYVIFPAVPCGVPT